MHTFRDLRRHFGSVPADVVALLSAADRSAGREQAFERQRPRQLEALRELALIESVESSTAIEDIHAPRGRIEALVERGAEPRNRSEQQIAGYRYVLDLIHADAAGIDFEPRLIEQLHGYLARYTGDRTAGHWKRLDNAVEEVHPDGQRVVRFVPVSAGETPAAMSELHEHFNRARAAGEYHHLLLSAAYVLDFLVIHPFRDGNGRMSRLITLWLLYLGGYGVGRFVSLEKLVEDSKAGCYDSLAASTVGWHQGEHDLQPWLEYFLGVVNAGYAEFESRTSMVAAYGNKQLLVKRFVAGSLSSEFTVEDVRRGAPGVGDSTIEKVLRELRDAGIIERQGRGRGSSWRRLRSDFLDEHPRAEADRLRRGKRQAGRAPTL